ncbi:MAG: thiamine-phosphate kinase [Planctomycetes bacterium]|jgi:thiamine-monophosphate kinase|nr:thiamine-phosphate kinase [Planctomycetota bacterium]
MREDEITGWFRQQRPLPPDAVPIGIGDDMAQLALGQGASVLITTDMLLDGTHFDLATATLAQVGYKSMAASLSDCAAMATIPLAAVVAVALPHGWSGRQLQELHAGVVRAADKYACPLVGGDITSWQGPGRFAVCVSMLSRPGDQPPVRRNGARVGDIIGVTGSLGGSGRRKHLEFEPRVREALRMVRSADLHAMMDISDGLSTDLNRICHQSGVGALVEAAAVPIAEDARHRPDPLEAALNEGEDFELLFTLSPGQWDRLQPCWDDPVPLTRVGVITATGRMEIRMADGQVRELLPGGYDHLVE